MIGADRFLALFRTAGGRQIGFGHIRRSWTLASCLADRGASIRFVAASDEAASVLAQAGFAVTIESSHESIDGTLAGIRAAKPPTVCIVDDPRLGSDALRELAAMTPVACLDDVGDREFPVSLVVNGSAGAQRLLLRGERHTKYLLGSRYIILRHAFAQPPERLTSSAPVRRVLLLSGGAGDEAIVERILDTVVRTLVDATVDVVTGPFSTPVTPHPRFRDRVIAQHCPADLYSLMLQADLAVAGGGQTLYELAATATPTIGVRLADNQTLNLRGLAEEGFLIDIGSPADAEFDDRLACALLTVSGDPTRRRSMGFHGREAVDGLGAARVTACLVALALGMPLPAEAEQSSA